MGGLIDEVPILSEVAKVSKKKNIDFVIMKLVTLVENARTWSHQGSAWQPQTGRTGPRRPLGGVKFQGKVLKFKILNLMWLLWQPTTPVLVRGRGEEKVS